MTMARIYGFDPFFEDDGLIQLLER